MKLYDLKHGDWFRITDDDLKVPLAHPDVDTDEWYWFGHVDGMYSYCHDKNGEVVHFAAWTEVEKVGKE